MNDSTTATLRTTESTAPPPPGPVPTGCRSVPRPLAAAVETRIEGGFVIVTGPVDRGPRWWAATRATQPPAKPQPTVRPARVAVMLALAHRLRKDLDRGETESQTALAKQLGFSRSRLTKLLDLTLLAPDIRI